MNHEAKTAIKDLVQLHQVLVNHFNEDELRGLCFELGVDYESLPGEGKASKARELVTHLERRDRIPELLVVGQRLRPKVAWAQAYLDDRLADYRARRDQADQARRAMRERQRVVNLRPLDVTHTFKDRVREMQELCEHLAQGGVRLVSVVGRGGMGKTALVSRVLADLERGILPVPGEDRELAVDGILYLSARSTGLSLERIYRDVGRMLGEPAAGRLAARWASGDTPLVAKVEYLLKTMGDGLYLILLDNLEDVLTEDGAIAEKGLQLFVERCLTQPGGARLIATSREQVQVIPAALRSARSIPLCEGLPESEAIALLRELDPQGELGLRDAPEDDLRRAVQLTGGIPRALEILAGILHEDPTVRLDKLLADEKLFGEQVVEELVAAGYQRLGENERQVMEALAVFDRPVEEAAIAYLLYPWNPGLDVRACLRRPISGYFVSVKRVTGEYSLHPLDREYAYRHLPNGDEPDAYNWRNLELRAADFYVRVRKPEDGWKSIEDLAPQLAEFKHRVRAGDYDSAYLTIRPIISYLGLWGHYALRAELQEELVDHVSTPGARLATLGDLGLTYQSFGQTERAIESFEEAVRLAREHGYRESEGWWLGDLGSVYRNLGQLDRATEFLEKALEIAREINDPKMQSAWLGDLGLVCHDLGQFGQAITFHKKALAIVREIEFRGGEERHLGNLGLAHRNIGKIESAIKLFNEALDIARQIGHRGGQSKWIGNLGIAYRALGETEQAISLYKEALAISREIGERNEEAIWLGNLGYGYETIGQFEQAKELYQKAFEGCRETNYRLGQSYSLLALSRVLLALGELNEARQKCKKALELEALGSDYLVSVTLGIILLNQGDPATEETLVDAIAQCQTILRRTADLSDARYALATALVGQAVCDPRWEQKSERTELLAPALTEYQQALENCSAPGIVRDVLRDLELIRAAGIEGLEPVFELLEGALTQAKHDDET